jgi:ankyrin repeat protein
MTRHSLWKRAQFLLLLLAVMLSSCTKEVDMKLLEASSNGEVALIRSLIEAGADPNISDLDGQTALVRAIRSNEFNSVATLLELGAKVNLTSAPGHSPLYWTTVTGCIKCAKILIRYGGKIITTAPSSDLRKNLADHPEIRKLLFDHALYQD